MSEYKKTSGSKPHEGWHAKIGREDFEWLAAGLKDWTPRPAILAFHVPILQLSDGTYVDVWRRANVAELLDFIFHHNVLALITGHWHRNMEWPVVLRNGKSVRLISTGTLLGQQWNETPPHYWLPTRPGYKLFCLSGGELRCFWKDLRAPSQVNLVWVGPVHTHGPRPQVRMPIVHSEVRLIAQAYAGRDEILSVEFGVASQTLVIGYQTKWKVRGWSKMTRSLDLMWSDWHGDLDPTGIEPGDYALMVRATLKFGGTAYDVVPVRISGKDSPVPAEPGFEQIFDLYYLPVN
jgi:hypothetical protein